MRRLSRLAPALLAVALLLLLLNSPPLGTDSTPLIDVLQISEIGSGQPPLHDVEVVVLHSIDWGQPRRARYGEAVVFLAGEVRRVGFNGELLLRVPRGNHSLSVYWADGRFVPFRTSLVVEKDLRVTVTFTEVRLRPEAYLLMPDVTKGITALTVSFSVFRLDEVYLALPFIKYLTTTGEVRAVPPASRPELVSVLPYSIRPSTLTAVAPDPHSLEEESVSSEFSLNVELPGIAATVLPDSYIPMLVIDYLVQPIEHG
ncbi:MAG: hypothetical protein NZ957_03145 [Thaumarchaeota archaeon]|nr:hypothetical protein [Candidatus Calditenuaceae archaeon]MDW8042184.1 hypothetical protein [Nitrososphaerota archaeon]